MCELFKQGDTAVALGNPILRITTIAYTPLGTWMPADRANKELVVFDESEKLGKL